MMMTMHWMLDDEGRLVVTWEKSENCGVRYGDHADNSTAISRLTNNRLTKFASLLTQRGKHAA